MKFITALQAGAVGALALNVLHESVRQVVPTAPRVDILGRRLIARGIHNTGNSVPDEDTLYVLAMVGDLVSNALYYSLVGTGSSHSALARGGWLGLGAGVGAVTLPKYLGLPEEKVKGPTSTTLMTIGWYTLGGLVAGWTARRLT